MDSLTEPMNPYTTITKQDHFRSICDPISDLDLAESKPSFHLKLLQQAGLIHAHKDEGRFPRSAVSAAGH
jgi:hypothetical protein